MSTGRHLTFWLLAALVIIFLLWLLNDVLMPFVAGFILAYLAVPLVDRLERRGVNRTVATLLIVVAVMVALIALPLITQQLLLLIASLPEQVARWRQLATDWLAWMQVGDSSLNLSEFVKQATAWLTTFAYSLWSG